VDPDPIYIGPIESNLLFQPIEHLRKLQGLAVQSSIFLTNGKIEPFQKRGAHVLHVNVLRISKNPSLLYPYHSISLSNFDYLCIAQLSIRFHDWPAWSTSTTCAWHFHQTMKSLQQDLTICIPAMAHKQRQCPRKSSLGLLHHFIGIFLFMPSHMGSQYQSILWGKAYPNPDLPRLLCHCLSCFFSTKLQSSSNSTLLILRSRNNQLLTCSLCSAARPNHRKTVSGLLPNTSAIPRTLIPLTKSFNAISTFSSLVRRSKKTVPVRSLNTLPQPRQIYFLTPPLRVEYLPLATTLPIPVFWKYIQSALGQKTWGNDGALPRFPILSQLLPWHLVDPEWHNSVFMSTN
jgi:hypothetical protein